MPPRAAFVFLLVLAAALPGEEASKAGAGVEALGWLAGHWRMEKAGRVIDEQWMAPAGGVMLGMSRTVAKGKVVEHEFIQLRTGPGGEVFYVALPSRQKEATFKASAVGPGRAVFENPEHDFPRRITYALQSDGALLATIEGPGADGATRKVEFAYRRVGP